MDWNGNFRVPFVNPRPAENSFSYLYNYNYDPVLDMKQTSIQATAQQVMLPTLMDKNMNNYVNDPKKKRLSNEQLELLENNFQDEIKLDPDRKMKLARELGLQPRQIAVWFQNRRARWKSKQLERLYDALKQEYDAVSRDKQKLQEEVLALRAILKQQAAVAKKQVSTDHDQISGGEETVDSTSIPITCDDNRSIINPTLSVTNNQLQQLHQIHDADDQCHNYGLINMDDDYNNNVNQVIMPPVLPYWPPMPSCPSI